VPTTVVRLLVSIQRDLSKTFKDLSTDRFKDVSKTFQPTVSMSFTIVSVSDEGIKTIADDNGYEFEEYPVGSLEFSAYHYHSNRNPFYIMFIKDGSKDSKGGSKIYIEMMNEYTRRHKIIDNIVMPFDVLEKNENLKKMYDLSLMMVNTYQTIYYDKSGMSIKQLVQTYDTDSEDLEDIEDDSIIEEDEDDEEAKTKKEAAKPQKPERPLGLPLKHWCISCDTVWKSLRVSKSYAYFNCYYSIDPFTFSYDVDTQKNIDGFIKCFNSFIRYNKPSPAIEAEIVANYENYLRVVGN
jgi:hypothetical protein